jgi:hypothetical protein
MHSVLYNLRCRRSRKGKYGCLHLNSSGGPVQWAKIPGLSCPARSVAFACLPVRDHHSNVRFCGQDCSDGTTGIPRHLRKTVTKRTKVQCLLSYLSTTSMGITGIKDEQKRPRQNIFPLVGSGTFLQHRIAGPILTLLSHLL